MSTVRNPNRADAPARDGRRNPDRVRRLGTETKASFKTTEFGRSRRCPCAARRGRRSSAASSAAFVLRRAVWERHAIKHTRRPGSAMLSPWRRSGS